MSSTKPQVLFLSAKHINGPFGFGEKDVSSMMEKLVGKVTEKHGEDADFQGVALDNDQEHDDKLRAALKETKFDIISFGGGIKMTSAEWADRVQTIIDESQCKGAKITKPSSPPEAVKLVLEAVEGLKKDS